MPMIAQVNDHRFINLNHPQLQLACVRAYNDFLTEWCSADPVRLLPIMALPFWDLSSCIDEIVRCAEMGHRGILFTGDPDRFGQPFLADRYWDPLWSVAQELGLPINFHIGNADADPITAPPFAGTSQLTHYAKLAVAAFMAKRDGAGDAPDLGMVLARTADGRMSTIDCSYVSHSAYEITFLGSRGKARLTNP